MAFCRNCGAKLNENDKFCSECGNPVIQNRNVNLKKETVFDGVVHKCPSCGEILNSFTSNCPSCGYEIRNQASNSNIAILAKKIEEIENSRPVSNSRSILKGLTKSTDHIDERKINLIRTFPIPNTKEDVLELCFLAYSNIDFDSYDDQTLRYSSRMVSEAWFSLFEHAYKKAQILLDAGEIERIDEMYRELKSKIKSSKFRIWKAIIIMYSVLIGIVGLIFLIAFLAGAFEDKNKNDELKDNPNAIVINYSDDDLKKMKYTDVLELLEKQGFKNIKVYETKLYSDLYELWQVKSISIDTDDNFYKGDYFLPDDLIIIYYYSEIE